MKSKTVNSHISLLIIVIAFTATCSAQQIWPGLEKGKYDVGYKIEQLYDASRNFKISPDSPVIQRPMQISIWYPAEAGPLDSHRQFQEYYWDHVSRFDFRASSLQKRNEELQEFLDLIKKNGGKEEKARRIFASYCMAITKAEHAPGRFPLVLYLPGRNSSAVSNSPLCEYLASNGFVVAAISSQGDKQPDVNGTKEGFDVLLKDLAFLREDLSLKSYVDKQKIALIGHSFGGMCATLYALDHDVDAVVNLDGSNFAPGWQALFHSFPNTIKPQLKAAYFHLMSDPPANSGFDHDTSFFDKLKANAILGKIKGFGHGDYMGMLSIFYLQAGMKPTMFPSDDMSFIGPGYANCSRVILALLNLKLQGIEDKSGMLKVNTDKLDTLKKGDLIILESR